jgi:EKC/KEOPS complex subunit CGI121/TPRKB
METFILEIFPEQQICFGLFENVSNSNVLKGQVKELRCGFVNPALLLNLDHLLLACCRALQARNNGNSKTNNVFLDMVYYLSGSSNIRESLIRFGIQEESKEIVLVTFDRDEFERVKRLVEGDLVGFQGLSRYTDLKKIQNEFKIPADERVNELVISRIAIKDI